MYGTIEPYRRLIIDFFENVKLTVCKHNHVLKFDSPYQVEEMLNDCFEIKNLSLNVEYEEGYWTLTGNPNELNQLEDVLSIFKKLYRHSAKDYIQPDKKDTDSNFLIEFKKED